jgi:hypothetical protein
MGTPRIISRFDVHHACHSLPDPRAPGNDSSIGHVAQLPFEDKQMNKYAAIASLIAASAFATPAYSEFYRPAPRSTAQNPRKNADHDKQH